MEAVDQGDENIVNPNVSMKEVIIIGDELAGDKSSLQNSFMKFRDQKIKEKNLMKACRDAALSGGRTVEYKDALRQKFIDTAKKYLGVPYGIKYKKEDEPVAPLYLDCCGLVRQAVQDLQEEFGFVIGKWNQAYQMDTLPIVLTEAELKPGDLIFYEGNYVSSRSKSQKHNNVHVEIFLGGETGEATIGSRFHSGRVSIFPSYKFTSTTWTLVKYHFRSLDSWLDGQCKSHCDEHPWHSDALNYLEAAGKRSIFAQQAQEDDCNAGGDDTDEGTAQGPAAAASAAVALCVPCEESEPVDDQRQQMMQKQEAQNELAHEIPAVAAAVAAKDINGAAGASSKSMKKPKRVSAFSGNTNPAASTGAGAATATPATPAAAPAPAPVVASAKLNRGSSRLSAPSDSTASSKAPSVSASSSTQLSSSSKAPKEGARCYYLGKTNGWKLVRAAMDKRGWTMMPTEYHFSTKYGFKWVERRNQIDYIAHVPGQLVCHIPNNDIITTKIGMLCTLRDKFCKQAAGSSGKLHPPWLPHTYDLESPADCLALIQEEERLASGAAVSRKSKAASVAPPKSPVTNKLAASSDDAAEDVPDAPSLQQQQQCDDDEDELQGKVGSDITGGIWIYKPSCTNRGRGIKVITGLPALKELCYGKPMGGGGDLDASTTTLPYKGIVQKYIRNPLLVTTEGYKFDVRCYLLIARNYPGTLAFYHPGYCRLALKPYTIATSASLEDNCVHLTNAAIQKKDAIYQEEGNKELQIQTVAAIADNLEELGKTDSADFLRNELDHQIKLCLVDVLKASNHVLLKKHGYFDLLGCDFMLSATNKLSMLEINTNPSLTLDNSTLANMLPDIVDGAIELVMQSQGPDRRPTDSDDFLKADLPGKFALIFDEATGYTYKGNRKGKSAKAKTNATTAPPATATATAADSVES